MKLERMGILLVACCLMTATAAGVAGAEGYTLYNYGGCRQDQDEYANYDTYGPYGAVSIRQAASFYYDPPYVWNGYLSRFVPYSMIAVGPGYENYPYSWNAPCLYSGQDSPDAEDSAVEASIEAYSETQPNLIYEVRSGDTLYWIARSFDVSVQALMDVNGIDDPRRLQVGRQLEIPGQEAEADSVQNSEIPAGNRIVKVLSSTLTAYTAGYESTGKTASSPGYGITYSGSRAEEGRTIAVDPSVIPLGTTVMIEGVGLRKAEDIGSAVRGVRIDVFMNDLQEALKFGVKKDVKVYVLADS
jgi:3D (Asp-Asp-Asp) domain-containing protein